MTDEKNKEADLWVKQLNAPPSATVRLICFPYAGAGAGAFRQFARTCPALMAVHGVEYPGRSSRAREAPTDSVLDLVAGSEAALASLLDRPFAVLGYSFGSLVAFEWVKRLEETGRMQPRALFLCARQAPSLPLSASVLHSLEGDSFIDTVQARYGGIPPELLADRELLELFLPALRADIRASETHHYRAGLSVACPIHVFGGQFDTTTSFVGLESWRSATQAEFSLRLLPTGHFFLGSHGHELLAAIVQALAPESTTLPPVALSSS